MKPQGLRSRLLAAVVIAVAVALAAITAAFNIVLDRRLNGDVNDLLRARASAELSALSTVDGRLSAREAPDAGAGDAPVWVFAGPRALEAPRASRPVDAAARALAAAPRRFADVPGRETRLLALPVRSRGRRVGTVVAGVSLAPYHSTARTALVASLALAGVVLVAVAVAGWWLIAAALRPVASMTKAAAQWSERDLDRRFALGAPHDELTALAATLDGLLDRLAASLRREQQFSGELSHELRTPLAKISAEAQLTLRDERNASEYRQALAGILDSSDQMRRTLDTLLAAARLQANPLRGTSDAAQIARAVAHACQGQDRAVVDVSPLAVPIRVGVDAEFVERILNPVVENACRYGGGHVRISVGEAAGGVIYRVHDGGAGVSDDERELIFEPGRRGRAGLHATGHQPGAGLGLPLARRLATAAGGEIEAVPSNSGGCFEIRLPTGY